MVILYVRDFMKSSSLHSNNSHISLTIFIFSISLASPFRTNLIFPINNIAANILNIELISVSLKSLISKHSMVSLYNLLSSIDFNFVHPELFK